MPPIGPVKRRDLVTRLRRLGFEGRVPAGAISSCGRDREPSECLTLITETSAGAS